jgi:hypothetical protein
MKNLILASVMLVVSALAQAKDSAKETKPIADRKPATRGAFFCREIPSLESQNLESDMEKYCDATKHFSVSWDRGYVRYCCIGK